MQYIAGFYSPEWKTEKEQWYFLEDSVAFSLCGKKEDRGGGGHTAARSSDHYSVSCCHMKWRSPLSSCPSKERIQSGDRVCENTE